MILQVLHTSYVQTSSKLEYGAAVEAFETQDGHWKNHDEWKLRDTMMRQNSKGSELNRNQHSR